MLRRKSEIIGYSIAATDGTIGTVADFLFDDSNWIVRWMIIDTGTWFSGRKVLLPPSAMKHTDHVKREFSVQLTMKQVKDSPNITADQSVTRHMEESSYNYYLWGAPYWTGPQYRGGYGYYLNGYGYMGWPRGVPLDELPDNIPHDHGDPHLRSVKSVTGYHIHATDGEIGHAEDFLVDEKDWSIHFLVIDTTNWWPGKRVLISPWSTTDINWATKRVNVDVTRKMIKESAAYDDETVVDSAYEKNIHTHRAGVRPSIHH